MSLISNTFVPYQYWNGKDPAGRLPSPRHVGRGQPRFFDYLTDAWEYYLNNISGGGGGNVLSIVGGTALLVNSGNVAAPIIGLDITGDGSRYNIPYINTSNWAATNKLQFDPLTSTLSVPALNLCNLGSPTGTNGGIFISSFTTSQITDSASSSGSKGKVMTAGPAGNRTAWDGLPFSTFTLDQNSPYEELAFYDGTTIWPFPWAGLTPNTLLVAVPRTQSGADILPWLCANTDFYGSNDYIVFHTVNQPGANVASVVVDAWIIKY